MLKRILMICLLNLLVSCQSPGGDANDNGGAQQGDTGEGLASKTQCTGQPIKVFDNTNVNVVANNGTSPTFNVPLRNGYDQTYCLERIYTYHWNGGNGRVAGKLGIEVNRTQKKWNATASASPAGNQNVDWNVNVTELIILRNSAGPYKVLDSHPASWSKNAGSNNKGFAKVWVTIYPDP